VLIEPRPYGPDAAPAELAELRARVWRIDDRLFAMKEVPIQTTFTLDLLFNRLEELAQGLDRFTYIVDLRGVKRPGPQVRETLRHRVGRLNPRLAHVGIVVGNTDVVIRAVAKLVAFALGFRSFTTHASVDEAVEACRRALR
jgi:hypothetical protein